MAELKKPTEAEMNAFNYRVKCDSLRKEFALGNIYLNAKKGIVFAEEFELDVFTIADTPENQKKHKATLISLLKFEGFSDCGEIYGYNKI